MFPGLDLLRRADCQLEALAARRVNLGLRDIDEIPAILAEQQADECRPAGIFVCVCNGAARGLLGDNAKSRGPATGQGDGIFLGALGDFSNFLEGSESVIPRLAVDLAQCGFDLSLLVSAIRILVRIV